MNHEWHVPLPQGEVRESLNANTPYTAEICVSLFRITREPGMQLQPGLNSQ